MKGLFYKFLVLISKLLGPWIFSLISRGIAAGYFLFFPKRVSIGLDFYKALFPKKSWFYHLACTWRQFQNFTSVFMDRLLLDDFGGVEFTSRGWIHIETALEKKTGGILLMSHLGNWDLAAHLLKKQRDNIPLLLYMGIRDKEDIERIQKHNLMENNIHIIGVDEQGGSAFDLLEGVRFLKSGGLVSLTGDIVWQDSQRAVPVSFLGHTIHLPVAPYALALLSGAPLFVFFSFRTGKRKYHFSASDPIFLKTTRTCKKEELIQDAAQQYADLLEQALVRHPFEWYHFEPFLENEWEL